MNDSIKICEKNRFSKFILFSNEEGMKILHRWMKWFAERRIKAVLAEHPQHGWAIYRNGLKEDGNE